VTTWAPPPQAHQPQDAHTWPSIPLLQQSISRNSRHGTNANHWSQPLYVGASPHPPLHNPLPRTQVSKASMGATHSACCHWGHHRTKHANSRPPTPMAPLHLPAITNHAHILCHCARATPSTNHYHYLTKTSLRCGASKEGTTLMAPPLHVQRWIGFTPLRAPCSRD
jgi:hypothetical protein